MSNQFDITKHKWSSENIKEVTESDNVTYLWLECQCGAVGINKDDAIAIAKHFHLLDLPSHRAGVTLNETVDIVFTDVVIHQSETTYKSLNLDSVGEIKDNELFNKESDSRG